MSRIMLVCPEPLGHGQPAGVGIRFLEMARLLRDDGHAVTVLSPDAGKVDGCQSATIGAETLRSISARSDAAVVQGHVINGFAQHAAPIPTVVDLYDPFIIENLHYFTERGREVFDHDHATLMTSLARGDFFLCASQAQRMFYLGLFLATRRLTPELFEHDPALETLLAVAPFGVPPRRPSAERAREGAGVLFGGIYDWYDPILAIEAMAIVRQTVPSATLTFTRHPNADITPQGKLADAIAHARQQRYDFVRFEPWAPYAERAAFFEQFALALITFRGSLETDLSMRTRIYDYLWCGLPIVTSSAPGTDEILARYGVGSVVAGDAAPLAAEVAALLTDRRRLDAMRTATARFVADHQWDRALAPLREFCAAPRSSATRDAFHSPAAAPDPPASILGRLRRRLRT